MNKWINKIIDGFRGAGPPTATPNEAAQQVLDDKMKEQSVIGSAEVNRALRKILHPALRCAGFTKFKGRCAWHYEDEYIWALQIRAVGNYFSLVTDYPPMSLCGELCIFFPDFPSTDPGLPDSKPPIDKDGLYIPKPQHCHIRYSLEVGLDQQADREVIHSKPERDRDDVWYVRKDGSNINAVVEDIRRSVVEWGIQMLQQPYNSHSEQVKRRGLNKDD